MSKKYPQIRLGNNSNTEIVKELLEELQYGYPMNEHGLEEIRNILYSLNQYVTLLTPDCQVVNIELTIEHLKHTIEGAREYEKYRKRYSSAGMH